MLAWRLTAALALALLGLCAFAAPRERVALLIGNGTYPSATLGTAVNDVRDLGAALRDLGFKTIVRENATRQDMIEAIRQFGLAIEGAEAALFFYSGHAMQFKGRNFLIPIDAQMRSEEDVTFFSVEIGQVFDRMEHARTRFNFLILNACRDKPFGGGFEISTIGLARMKAPPGALIAFSASPGEVTPEDSGRNSLYAKHLLRHIAVPGLPVEVMFKLVREDIERETRARQSPWESAALGGDFAFKPAAPAQEAAKGESAPPGGAPPSQQAATPVEKAMARLQELAAGRDIAAGVKELTALAKERLGTLLKPEGATETPASATAPTVSDMAKPQPFDQGSEIAPGIREIVFPDGSTYRGSMRGAAIHGKGEYVSKSFRYQGEFRNGLKHGTGIYTWENGDRYEGEFRDDRPNGKGKYQFASGDRYEGEVKAGVMSGNGTYVSAGGDQFDGTFSEGKPEGTGTYRFANGDRYEGEVSAGKPQGKGRYFTIGGDRIEAPFIAGRAEGRGTYFFANGDRYEGDFQAGSLTGRGTYHYATGLKYEGDIVEGRPQGQGVIAFADGLRFEGTFENGIDKAKGELVRTDGSRAPAEIESGSVRLLGARRPTVVLPEPGRAPAEVGDRAARPAEPAIWSGNL